MDTIASVANERPFSSFDGGSPRPILLNKFNHQGGYGGQRLRTAANGGAYLQTIDL